MRVLVLEDSKLQSVETLEIVDIGYKDDLLFEKDVPIEKRKSSTLLYGLYMVTQKDEYLYIPKIQMSHCNIICRSIMETGYYDLTNYGEYECAKIERG